jgi:hypothetical protein
MRGFPPIEPGMGSLEPVDSPVKPLVTYKEKECHGALIKLTADNYQKVMASEGVSDDNPNPGYEEIVVDAYPYHQNSTSSASTDTPRPIQAIALRARPHVRLQFDPSPSVRYMNILKEGAKELNLKPCYQEFLSNHPVHDIPLWKKKFVVYNLVFHRLFFGRRLLRMQSRILFWVYAPPTSNVVHRCISDGISNLVLFPGFLLGYSMCKTAEIIRRKKLDAVTRLMAFLAPDD